MSKNSEKINLLEEQILLLKKEDVAENQAKILPFLKDGKATCDYNGSYNFLDMTVNDVNINELIQLIQDEEDSGHYHFGCPISAMAELRYDDGKIHIYFKFSGNNEAVKEQFLKEVKFLGITINFANYKSDIMRDIKRNQKTLNDIIELEKEVTQLI